MKEMVGIIMLTIELLKNLLERNSRMHVPSELSLVSHISFCFSCYETTDCMLEGKVEGVWFSDTHKREHALQVVPCIATFHVLRKTCTKKDFSRGMHSRNAFVVTVTLTAYIFATLIFSLFTCAFSVNPISCEPT